MNLISAGRGLAVFTSVVTIVYLFLHDSWRSDNLFLVPDLVLCTLLLVAAALPRPYAVPAMGFAFAMTTGVFATSASSYAVRGELSAVNLLSVTACAVMAVLLIGNGLGSRAARDQETGHRRAR